MEVTPGLDPVAPLSTCPRFLPGSTTSLTLLFNSFVSGKPPSVLRSQRSFVTSLPTPPPPVWAASWPVEDSAKGRLEDSDSVVCLSFPSPSPSPCSAQAAKGRSEERDSVTCLPAPLSCLSSRPRSVSSAKGALEEREGVFCDWPGAGEVVVVMLILKVPDLEGRRETSFKVASKVERSSWAYCFLLACVDYGTSRDGRWRAGGVIGGVARGKLGKELTGRAEGIFERCK